MGKNVLSALLEKMNSEVLFLGETCVTYKHWEKQILLAFINMYETYFGPGTFLGTGNTSGAEKSQFLMSLYPDSEVILR